MQVSRGMKIGQAKEYVAGKLGVSVRDLVDPVIMREVRQELQLGLLHLQVGFAMGIEAKFHIAEVLDLDINCVRRFKAKV
jgi:dimethylamine--corrinoid protein Co-methyltransferase